MHFEFNFKNCRFSKGGEEIIKDRMFYFQHLLPVDFHLHVTVEKHSKDVFEVHLMLTRVGVERTFVSGKETGIYLAIGTALDKLERKIKKHQNKMHDRQIKNHREQRDNILAEAPMAPNHMFDHGSKEEQWDSFEEQAIDGGDVIRLKTQREQSDRYDSHTRITIRPRAVINGLREFLARLEVMEAMPVTLGDVKLAINRLEGIDASTILDSAMLASEEILGGVSKALRTKLANFVNTGHFTSLEQIKKATPTDFDELIQVPGIGPKRLGKLHHELGIKTVADLRKAAAEHKIKDVEGFGPYLEEQILRSVG